jgi:RNA polymerase sigma-70 factor (ECF subfamily)
MDNTDMEKTDEELALMVQNGNKEKFGVLMGRYEPKLFRYGKKFLSDPDNIEDVVQDVFIKTYQNIQSFDVNQKFSSWIYRIAHNTYINLLKKNSRGPLYILDFDTFLSYTVVDDPIIREKDIKEMRIMVEKGLNKLSPKYREIIVLYYLEELSYKEISDILQMPIGTVGIRLKRAKEALRDVYKKLDLHYEQ